MGREGRIEISGGTGLWFVKSVESGNGMKSVGGGGAGVKSVGPRGLTSTNRKEKTLFDFLL